MNAGPLEMIVAERLRQQAQEGFTPAHDDEHTKGQLALLAAAYALSSCNDEFSQMVVRNLAAITGDPSWPFKPAKPIRDLERAGALILAELERRLRADGPALTLIIQGRQTCTAVCPPMWKHGSCGEAHYCVLPQGHGGQHRWECQNAWAHPGDLA